MVWKGYKSLDVALLTAKHWHLFYSVYFAVKHYGVLKWHMEIFTIILRKNDEYEEQIFLLSMTLYEYKMLSKDDQ